MLFLLFCYCLYEGEFILKWCSPKAGLPSQREGGINARIELRALAFKLHKDVAERFLNSNKALISTWVPESVHSRDALEKEDKILPLAFQKQYSFSHFMSNNI